MASSTASSRCSTHGGRVGVVDEVALAEGFAGFVVHVRTLHALDLITDDLGPQCPVVRISVNNGEPQSCVAAQTTKSHSIWRRHAMTFKLEGSEWFSVQVAVLRGDSSQLSLSRESNRSTVEELGSLGELRLPVKTSDYEVTRFFQLFRRVYAASASDRRPASYTLAPAGRIKLRIQFEAVKPVATRTTLVDKPSIATNKPPGRSLFGSPAGFLENLQLQRRKLKATVVPVTFEPSLGNAGHKGLSKSSTDPTFLARETALLPPSHIVRADELQLKDPKAVGEGAHSCVRLAVMTSARGLHSGDATVAVKEFRYLDADSPPQKVVEAFLHEYRVLASLPPSCEHVAAFKGVVLEPRLAIVMELCTHGSIAQLMSDTERWQRISFVELARGIACLHQLNIVHRDIKPHNILLTSDGASAELVVKVGDLGSAAFHPPEAPPLTEETGSSGYTAPEVFTGGGYDCQVDVWSFAIVLWEVFAPPARPENPFVGIDTDEFVRRAEAGVRPDVTRLGHAHGHSLSQVSTISAVRCLMEACWAFSPRDRPTMDEVVRTTHQLHAAMSSH